MDASTSPTVAVATPVAPVAPPPVAVAPVVPSITDTDITALLSRLSSKTRVQSLLVLARSSGAVIRASGAISRADAPLQAEYAAAVWKYVKASEELVSDLAEAGQEREGDEGTGAGVRIELGERKGGDRSEGEGGDEVRLLRLRTKKRECVVVPDSKFILVVFHDTPVAP
ncbi:hypothetical protein EDC01DRAFT_783690 [Geopyxis carbonaria]|nr:hypothetical protein EDC01DRAFT_783690 [Geopyxis carbonaria]